MVESHEQPTVLLYTQDRCSDSPRVRDWLRSHGIPFRERNVSREPAYATDLAATGIFATPLLVVNDQKLLGYRPDQLSALFGVHDEPAG